MNVLDGDELPLPLLALAGSEAPKLRTTAASAALMRVAPARRPPCPKVHCRGNPHRVYCLKGTCPVSVPQFVHFHSPFSRKRGPQFRNNPPNLGCFGYVCVTL